MRQVVLDTETTGLAVEKGHRVVEIGCIELLERRPTGRSFQRYLNPYRAMDRGAQEVTGLTDEFLADKPAFSDVADEFVEFIDGAELIIHNASFDVGFLDAELARLGPSYRQLRDMCGIVDSLQIARERYPGQRNSLDALCKRLQVDNTHRTLHGALLDAQLLLDVYLNLTSGQADLGLEAPQPRRQRQRDGESTLQGGQMEVNLRFATNCEEARHRVRLEALLKGGACCWQEPENAMRESVSVVA
jgi:DNA polymerase-3 subunit epsilon